MQLPSYEIHVHSYLQKHNTNVLNVVMNVLKANNRDTKATSFEVFWCLYCQLRADSAEHVANLFVTLNVCNH